VDELIWARQDTPQAGMAAVNPPTPRISATSVCAVSAKPKNQRIGPRYRQVLKALAKAPRGGDVNALLSRGFAFGTLADLVNRGLATVRLERMRKGGRTIELARMVITAAGRKAIAPRRSDTARRPRPH
jgi:hypothetical protein